MDNETLVKDIRLFGEEAVRIVEALKDIGEHNKNLSLTLNPALK